MISVPFSPKFLLAFAGQRVPDFRYHEEQTMTRESIQKFFSRENPQFQPIQGDLLRLQWKYGQQGETNSGFVGCKLIAMPPRSNKMPRFEDFADLPLRSLDPGNNVVPAYVRSGDQLFYINTVDKTVAEIKVGQEQLNQFDNELRPINTFRELSKTELERISDITGHVRRAADFLSQDEIQKVSAIALSTTSSNSEQEWLQGGFLNVDYLMHQQWLVLNNVILAQPASELVVTRNPPSTDLSVTHKLHYTSIGYGAVKELNSADNNPLILTSNEFLIQEDDDQDRKIHAQMGTNYKFEINNKIWDDLIIPAAISRLDDMTPLQEEDLFKIIPCLCDPKFIKAYAERLAKGEENSNIIARSNELINLCFEHRPNDIEKIDFTVHSVQDSLTKTVDLLKRECIKHEKYLSKFQDETRVKQHTALKELNLCFQTDSQPYPYKTLSRFAEIFANNQYILKKDADSRGIKFLKTIGNIIARVLVRPAAFLAIYKGSPKFWKSREEIFYSNVQKHTPAHKEKFKYVLSKEELVDRTNDPQSSYSQNHFLGGQLSIKNKFFEIGQNGIEGAKADIQRGFLIDGKDRLGYRGNLTDTSHEEFKELLTAALPPSYSENDIDNLINGFGQSIASPIPDILLCTTIAFEIQAFIPMAHVDKPREDGRVINIIPKRDQIYSKAHYDRFLFRDKEGVIIGYLEGTTEVNYQLRQKKEVITGVDGVEEKKESAWGFDLINFKTDNPMIYKILRGDVVNEDELKRALTIDPLVHIKNIIEHYIEKLEAKTNENISQDELSKIQPNLVSLQRLKSIIDAKGLPKDIKLKQFSATFEQIKHKTPFPHQYTSEAFTKLSNIQSPINLLTDIRANCNAYKAYLTNFIKNEKKPITQRIKKIPSLAQQNLQSLNELMEILNRGLSDYDTFTQFADAFSKLKDTMFKNAGKDENRFLFKLGDLSQEKWPLLNFNSIPTPDLVQGIHEERIEGSRILNDTMPAQEAISTIDYFARRVFATLHNLNDDEKTEIYTQIEQKKEIKLSESERTYFPIFSPDRNNKLILQEKFQDILPKESISPIIALLEKICEFSFSAIYKENGEYQDDIKRYFQNYFGNNILEDLSSQYKDELPNKLVVAASAYFVTSDFIGSLNASDIEAGAILWQLLQNVPQAILPQYIEARLSHLANLKQKSVDVIAPTETSTASSSSSLEDTFNLFHQTYQKLMSNLNENGIDVEPIEISKIDFEPANAETVETVKHYRQMVGELLSEAIENELYVTLELPLTRGRGGESASDFEIRALRETIAYMRDINEAVRENKQSSSDAPKVPEPIITTTMSALEPAPIAHENMNTTTHSITPDPSLARRVESHPEISSALESKIQKPTISYQIIEHKENNYASKLQEALRGMKISATKIESAGNLNAGQRITSDIIDATHSRIGNIDGGAVIVERLEKNQIRSELLVLPDELSPARIWEQNIKKADLKSGETFSDDFLNNMFADISKEVKSRGRDITEKDIQKYLQNRGALHPNNNATILFKAYNDAYQKAIYNNSKDKFPSNDLIKIAIQQVESRRQLDKTPIVIKEAFSPAYAEAISLYCHAKGYEVHKSHLFVSLFDSKVPQKRIEQMTSLLNEKAEELGYDNVSSQPTLHKLN